MNDERTSTCSRESVASPSPQHGRDTAPSGSARSTPSASESSESTGQMSLFGTTCERWTPTMYATPQAHDAQGGSAERVRRFGSRHGGRNLSDETVAGISPFSPQAIPVSHSQSPGSDWARRMTATYGRKFVDYWLNSDPPDSWVRTLLGTSVWASTMCYLTWKRSATPQGRLLFRLVPSTPRIDGIGSGFWGTPAATEVRQGYQNRYNGKKGSQESLTTVVLNDARMWPTPRASENENRTTKPAPSHGNGHGKVLAGEVGQTNDMKLNSAWVSRMMGYPDSWLDLTTDGEETP